jgi:hypothetical protein
MMTKAVIAPGDYAGLHKEVVSVVESARRTAARNVNAVMTAAYWEIGWRIVASEQGGQARAGYLPYLRGDHRVLRVVFAVLAG